MSPAPRSLSEALRAADDAALVELLAARPDLARPAPADLGQLAARAATLPSTRRAMDRLDRFHLQVLQVACLVEEPFDSDELAAQLPAAAPDRVAQAVGDLVTRALLWGSADRLVVASAVREAVGAWPAGLGPDVPTRLRVPGAGPGGSDAGEPDVPTLAAAAPPAAAAVLDRLTWGPPVGTLGDGADGQGAEVAAGVEWLVAAGLVVRSDPRTVVLPRAVGLALRGGSPYPQVLVEAPRPVVTTTASAQRVDATAAATAFAVTRLVRAALDAWAADAPTVLRAGGLGVRELRRLATVLDVAEPVAALVVETAYAAGLLAPSDDADPVWLPTPAFDTWAAQPEEQAWVDLVTAWLGGTRLVGLVGGRDERDRAVVALGPDLERASAPAMRAAALAVLADVEVGAVVGAGEVERVLDWQRPAWPARLRGDVVAWTLREAEALGVTGLGALASPARALLRSGPDAAREVLAPLLPVQVDHVLLQADLTAVAPGPLTAELATDMALLADVESTGGATVFRFSEASLRRALDAGRSASDVLALLASASTTGIPQPLTYLVEDVGRRHGRVRVGGAAAFVRCDDPAVVAELASHRRLAELRLRPLAPTVLVAQAPPETVLERLRALGYAPAAEGSDGSVVVARAARRRTPVRPRPPRLVAEPAPGDPATLAAVVRALRAGERAARVGRTRDAAPVGLLPRTAAGRTLALLREAVSHGRPVWIGYADSHGAVSERIVDPVRVDGGFLTAFDHRSGQVHSFAVHRISGVAAADEEEPA